LDGAQHANDQAEGFLEESPWVVPTAQAEEAQVKIALLSESRVVGGGSSRFGHGVPLVMIQRR
jgi:hypothetical protein